MLFKVILSCLGSLLFSFSSLSRDPAKTRPPAWRQAWRSVWSSFVTLSFWPWNVNHPSNGSSSVFLPCSSFLLVYKPHPISRSPCSLCLGLCGVWQGWKCPGPGASSWLLRTCCHCSAGKSCPTLCHPMNCSTPGFPVLHSLLEFAQTQVHRVSDAIQPSHPLLPPSFLALNLSQIFEYLPCFSHKSMLYLDWRESVMWEFLALKSESESCSVVSTSLQPHGLYNPWNSPGQNTGGGNRSLLQAIFPTQG